MRVTLIYNSRYNWIEIDNHINCHSKHEAVTMIAYHILIATLHAVVYRYQA